MAIVQHFWQFILCGSFVQNHINNINWDGTSLHFLEFRLLLWILEGFLHRFQTCNCKIGYLHISMFRQGPSVDWNFSCCVVAGEDLLSIGADQPFRFPATFTFVVRAFSGIANILSLEIVMFLLLKTDFLTVICFFFPSVLGVKTLFLWFAVLDGIGKGLDPRFDISEIAKP